MTAKCPMCGKAVKWEGNLFRPFCSERCQLLDLEGWFSERYRMPQAEEDEPEETLREHDSSASENGAT
jgi:endogenous inhibitor of DNA gyrase (YacG/DUF329 family)